MAYAKRGMTVARLDKYWTNQDVVYDFKSDLTGTGGLPVCA